MSSAATAEEKVILPLANTQKKKIDIRIISELEKLQLERQQEEIEQRAKAAAAKAEKERLAAEARKREEEEQRKKEEEEKRLAAQKSTTNPSSYEPAGGSFKSYTNYQLLSKSSPQWTKIQCNPNVYSDENGLRKVDGYYCVAMGSYYTKTLGDLFEIQTEGGTFQVIICDWKDDSDTDSTNRYTVANGCMIEFYVDMTCFNSTARRMGDVSYASSIFQGKVLRVTKIGNYFS